MIHVCLETCLFLNMGTCPMQIHWYSKKYPSNHPPTSINMCESHKFIQNHTNTTRQCYIHAKTHEHKTRFHFMFPDFPGCFQRQICLKIGDPATHRMLKVPSFPHNHPSAGRKKNPVFFQIQKSSPHKNPVSSVSSCSDNYHISNKSHI